MRFWVRPLHIIIVIQMKNDTQTTAFLLCPKEGKSVFSRWKYANEFPAEIVNYRALRFSRMKITWNRRSGRWHGCAHSTGTVGTGPYCMCSSSLAEHVLMELNYLRGSAIAIFVVADILAHFARQLLFIQNVTTARNALCTRIIKMQWLC